MPEYITKDDLNAIVDKALVRFDKKLENLRADFDTNFEGLKKRVDQVQQGLDAHGNEIQGLLKFNKDSSISSKQQNLAADKNKEKDDKEHDAIEDKESKCSIVGGSMVRKGVEIQLGFLSAFDGETQGLPADKLFIPLENRYQLVTNAIEGGFRDWSVFKNFPMIERKYYVGVQKHKEIEFADRRNNELMSSTKEFDSKNVMDNFDEYLKGFWRSCVRLHIADHMAIKYSLFENLDAVSKTVCSEHLDPGNCSDWSVFKYFSGMRKVLLPLNDLSSARKPYTNFLQNDLPLDLFFEKKHSLFKRCHEEGEIRRHDYLDFYQNICDTLSHKVLAVEVRKVSKDLVDTDGAKNLQDFRRKMINLGESLYQSSLSNQIDDLYKHTLITQSMTNNLVGVENEKGVVGQTDGYNEYLGQGYDSQDQGDYDEECSQVMFDNDDCIAAIAVAENDMRACFWCFEQGHLIRDCEDIKNKKPPHVKSMYYKSRNTKTNNAYSSNQAVFRNQPTSFGNGSYNNSYGRGRGVVNRYTRPFRGNVGRNFSRQGNFIRNNPKFKGSPSFNNYVNKGENSMQNKPIAQCMDQVISESTENKEIAQLDPVILYSFM